MAGLTRRATTVTDASGRVVPAYVGECACGGGEFVLFQLMESMHLHVQCVACGVAYCPNAEGGCHETASGG